MVVPEIKQTIYDPVRFDKVTEPRESWTLRYVLSCYVKFYFCIFLPLLFIHEESVTPGALINNHLRSFAYNKTNLHDYLASDPLS